MRHTTSSRRPFVPIVGALLHHLRPAPSPGRRLLFLQPLWMSLQDSSSQGAPAAGHSQRGRTKGPFPGA